ncbi:hypothetical protein EJ08DRAFT_681763 [Tothia fuscella]|uniref:PNPLA domain-containing protein n=1 Tax=Tothia fuscella TaxID=1048955 RepID=A0A9P4NKQ9_9PEZI|nr:hypothetical protein EJ08DRAFT_681763 [Tothia fuscella]
MEQAKVDLSPRDSDGLCLLSFDGGGVRGLSSLYILKTLMDRLNHERRTKYGLIQAVKPCEVFDMICGTSTGGSWVATTLYTGLIAIMLGRLEMDVDDCIKAYGTLSEKVFKIKMRRLPTSFTGTVKPRFDSALLVDAIREVIAGSKYQDPATLFNDGVNRGCRTFVCTIGEQIGDIIRLRSYDVPSEPNTPKATVLQAALATSAATTFFEPVRIGNLTFADGALGANNPVDEMEGEASLVYCYEEFDHDMKSQVKCFISIGTGHPRLNPAKGSLAGFVRVNLVKIATDTENIAKRSIERWAKLYEDKRYFRFNVQHGLQDVDLEEYQKRESLKQQQISIWTIPSRRREFLVSNSKPPPQPITHKVVWQVPFDRNPYFIGRKEELSKLERDLFAPDRTTKIAVWGLGGIGKTQLVLELAHRVQKSRRDCSVIWLPANDRQVLQEAFHDAVLEFGLLDAKPAEAEAHNTDAKWIKLNTQGNILFTTRDLKTAQKLASQNTLSLKHMELLESKVLFGNCFGNELHLEDGKDIMELLKQLECLPLAIVQAASYAKVNQIRPATYLSMLSQQLKQGQREDDVIKLLNEDFDNGFARNPVAATWLISFKRIRRYHPLAARYLSFIVTLDHKSVPQSLLPPGPSAKDEVDAVGTLKAYSFLNGRVDDEGRTFFDVHRLVYLASRHWLRIESSHELWAEVACARLAEIFPRTRTNPCQIFGQQWHHILPHAQYILNSDLVDKNDLFRLVLALNVAIYLCHIARDKESFLLLVETHEALMAPQTLLGKCSTTQWLCGVFCLPVQWDKPERILRQVDRLQRQSSPHTSPLVPHPNQHAGMPSSAGEGINANMAAEVQSTLNGLQTDIGGSFPNGLIYCCKGKLPLPPNGVLRNEGDELATAATGQEEALRIWKEEYGIEHESYLDGNETLALIYLSFDREQDSQEVYRSILGAYRKLRGPGDDSTLYVMRRLAESLSGHANQAQEEETLVREAMHLMSRDQGISHPLFDYCLKILGCAAATQGRNLDSQWWGALYYVFGLKPEERNIEWVGNKLSIMISSSNERLVSLDLSVWFKTLAQCTEADIKIISELRKMLWGLALRQPTSEDIMEWPQELIAVILDLKEMVKGQKQRFASEGHTMERKEECIELIGDLKEMLLNRGGVTLEDGHLIVRRREGEMCNESPQEIALLVLASPWDNLFNERAKA